MIRRALSASATLSLSSSDCRAVSLRVRKETYSVPNHDTPRKVSQKARQRLSISAQDSLHRYRASKLQHHDHYHPALRTTEPSNPIDQSFTKLKNFVMFHYIPLPPVLPPSPAKVYSCVLEGGSNLRKPRFLLSSCRACCCAHSLTSA